MVKAGKWIKNTLIYLALRLLLGLVRRLRWERSRRFGCWLGRRAWRLARSERHVCLEQLAWAFPEMDEQQRQRLSLRVFEHLGRAAAEVANVRRAPELSEWVEVGPESRRVLDEALARGRGVVFITAHCGNWELMARSLARLGYPINTIGRASYDPRLTRLIDDFRKQGGVHTLWRGEPDLGHRLVEVLRRGEVMGFLIDQDTRVPGEFVPFFGKLAHTPSAPVSLARKSGAVVVVGFNHRRQPDGYSVVMYPFQLSRADDPRQALLDDLTALNHLIERHISAHPEEWVWMHRRYKTRPPGEDGARQPGTSD